MALDALQAAETINELEIFIDKIRPPENIRDQVDINYKIENQSIIIFEIRPHWLQRGKTIESHIAKTTWVHRQKVWKVFWMRGDLKWYAYEPTSKVKSLGQFLKLVDEDKHGCFWG